MAPGFSLIDGAHNVFIAGGDFSTVIDNSINHYSHHDYEASGMVFLLLFMTKSLPGTALFSADSPELIRRLRPPHHIKDLLIPLNQQARAHKTCLWSVENPVIKTWLEPQEPLRYFWLFGRPGTGKSVLAAFLIDRILKQHNNKEEITLYYFCKNKDDTPVHILKDFIRQFLQRNDHPIHPDVAIFVKDILSQRIEYEFSMEEIEPYFLKFLGLFNRKW